MYKSLFFTAVALFEGVSAQNMTIDGINYACWDSPSPGCQIDIDCANTEQDDRTSLTWSTVAVAADRLDFEFDFGNLRVFLVRNCDNLQEIDFSGAPSGQTISYPSGSGGLVMERLPNLHTINLGAVTEVGYLNMDTIGTSLVDDYALNFKAPHLHTVTTKLWTENLSIDELRFDALRVIGDKDSSFEYECFYIQPGTNINTISLPAIEYVHNIRIENAEYVGSIVGLFPFPKMALSFDPSVFETDMAPSLRATFSYDGLRIRINSYMIYEFHIMIIIIIHIIMIYFI